MKKIIALLLVCSFLTFTLLACNKTEKPTEAPPATETETATDEMGQPALDSDKSKWSELDFDQETLTVVVRNDEKVYREWEAYESSEDELTEAIRTRNEIVMSDLNIDVNIEPVASGDYRDCQSVYTTLISQDVDNKIHDYDIIAHFAYIAAMPAIRDYNANLLDKDTFPYFNFDLPCWNQSIAQNVRLNGKLFYAAGDMNLSLFDSAMIMWHNMDLYDQIKNVEKGDPESIQELVMANQWTFAELYKWCTTYHVDDSESDCGDNYALYLEMDYVTQPNDAIPYAWDIEILTTEADGTHKFNIVGNDKLSKAVTNWTNLQKAEGVKPKHTCNCGLKGSHFVAGDRLFSTDILYRSKSDNAALREMTQEYSIIPLPKYDESQENYGSTAQDYYTLMTVLDHSNSPITTKGEAISAYLEWATEYSYTYVRGYYFTKIITQKWFGTDDSNGHVSNSRTIFYTIIDNLEFDFWTIHSPQMGNIAHVIRYALRDGTSVESQYTTDRDRYDDALKDMDDWYFDR